MRFTVDPWDPSYGTSSDLDPVDASRADVDCDVEVPAGRWAPRPGGPSPGTERLVFVDGVRRVEAHVWIDCGDGTADPGICASYAAGAVRCDGMAVCGPFVVGRGLFTAHGGAEAIESSAGEFAVRVAPSGTPERLALALQERMAEAELEAAEAACAAAAGEGGTDAVVVDGPLRGRQHLTGAVGYVKTHHVTYLPPEQNAVVGRLGPGNARRCSPSAPRGAACRGTSGCPAGAPRRGRVWCGASARPISPSPGRQRWPTSSPPRCPGSPPPPTRTGGRRRTSIRSPASNGSSAIGSATPSSSTGPSAGPRPDDPVASGYAGRVTSRGRCRSRRLRRCPTAAP